MRYGEADRILHVYTPHRGRVSAIAKGVRRARSRFGGRLEPFFRLRIELHEGRGDLLTVTGAQTVDGHPSLRGDAHALDAAARACDAVGRLFETSEPHPGVFNLLCRKLALLDEDPAGATRGERARVPPEAARGGGARAPARFVRVLRRARASRRLLGRRRGSGVRRVLAVRVFRRDSGGGGVPTGRAGACVHGGGARTSVERGAGGRGARAWPGGARGGGDARAPRAPAIDARDGPPRTGAGTHRR